MEKIPFWRRFTFIASLRAYLHTMFRLHPTYYVHNKNAIWCAKCNYYFWWKKEPELLEKHPKEYASWRRRCHSGPILITINNGRSVREFK